MNNDFNPFRLTESTRRAWAQIATYESAPKIADSVLFLLFGIYLGSSILLIFAICLLVSAAAGCEEKVTTIPLFSWKAGEGWTWGSGEGRKP